MISPVEGVLRVRKDVELDRETIAFYNLTICARDRGVPPLSSTVSLGAPFHWLPLTDPFTVHRYFYKCPPCTQRPQADREPVQTLRAPTGFASASWGSLGPGGRGHSELCPPRQPGLRTCHSAIATRPSAPSLPLHPFCLLLVLTFILLPFLLPFSSSSPFSATTCTFPLSITMALTLLPHLTHPFRLRHHV